MDRFTAASLRGMRIFMIDGEAIRQRWDAVGSKLDERGRRLFAALVAAGLTLFRGLIGALPDAGRNLFVPLKVDEERKRDAA